MLSEVVRQAAPRFPEQASGFMLKDGNLYQVAVTPVSVQSGRGLVLLDVLVAGFKVDPLVAQRLKEATGGSEFLFLSQGRVIASTLNPRATSELTRAIASHGAAKLSTISDGVMDEAVGIARTCPMFKYGGELEVRHIAELKPE